MASHARPQPSRIPRTLLRTALAFSAAGAALAAGGSASASATPSPAPAAHPDQGSGTPLHTVTRAVRNSVTGAPGAVKNLQLNPLANTPVDPLNNALETKVADFKPLSTTSATGPLSSGAALKDLPLVGRMTRVLPK
ncbi:MULTISPECIES: hypothetical protein [unclassified Streptomyces]|uniref:hypothetical protein n=1 Tax=unclassified Streptomyces TaxID=2593676 RepID=UPI003823FF51